MARNKTKQHKEEENLKRQQCSCGSSSGFHFRVYDWIRLVWFGLDLGEEGREEGRDGGGAEGEGGKEAGGKEGGREEGEGVVWSVSYGEGGEVWGWV